VVQSGKGQARKARCINDLINTTNLSKLSQQESNLSIQVFNSFKTTFAPSSHFAILFSTAGSQSHEGTSQNVDQVVLRISASCPKNRGFFLREDNAERNAEDM
jgi:hypothetical protein